MQTIKTVNGSQQVISTRNADGCVWTSTVYVNNGETITGVTAKHTTVAGVKRWAAKQLSK